VSFTAVVARGDRAVMAAQTVVTASEIALSIGVYVLVRDRYALRVQPYIRAEIEAANRVIDKIRELAPRRPDALSPLMDVLEQLLATWERLTRPIQVSATLQGKTDDDSEHLAFAIRGLSIDLFNDYDLLDQSRRVSAMIASNFQAIPRVADKLAEDGAALENFAE